MHIRQVQPEPLQEYRPIGLQMPQTKSMYIPPVVNINRSHIQVGNDGQKDDIPSEDKDNNQAKEMYNQEAKNLKESVAIEIQYSRKIKKLGQYSNDCKESV
jgi:hypothetical protein